MNPKTILSFIRALPVMLRLLKEVWDVLANFYRAYDRKVRIKRLADALKTAKETKDTAAIEKFFNPGGAPVPNGSTVPESETGLGSENLGG